MNAVIQAAPSLAAFFGRFATMHIFVVWKRVPRDDGRTDKVPVSIETGVPIDGQLVENRMTLAEAELWVSQGAGDGVGVVITPESGLFFLDLDKCRDANDWMPHAKQFVARFPGAYLEVSQSGQGLHVIGSYNGERPTHGTRNKPYRLELYSGARFCALTGIGASGSIESDHTEALRLFLAELFRDGGESAGDDAAWTAAPQWHVPGGPDDDELIRRASRRTSAGTAFGGKASFKDLWTANADALAKTYPPQGAGQSYDASSADIALTNHLMWWTGGDCERVANLMRNSALAVGRQDKWDRLLRGTILKAHALIAKNPPKDKTAEPAATEADPRSVVLLSGGKFAKYAEQCEKLIADAIYVRGDKLVRIGRAVELVNSTDGIKRDDAQAVFISASSAWIRRELLSRAQFWKYDKRSGEWEPKDCPKELADNIGDQVSWSTFRPLIAVSPVPILRHDLSVWTAPGYDAVTGVYYQPTIRFPPILAAPTRADALQALARLLEPFDEFPYATPEARSAFLSHVISAILRPSFDTCPIFVYTAPDVATGKTLLSSMANRIAHGTPAAQHPYAEKEELRKTLFAALLAGDPELIMDNIPRGMKVRADGLCVFATSAMYGDRILGVSENRKVPNRLIVALTGNNITPAGDLSRRALSVHLDVDAETARGRNFRIEDLPAYVNLRRAQFIVDALTIVRAYAFAGRPKVAHALESFEQWAKLVRDPLVWLGMADPVATQTSEADDDDSASLPGAFAAIAAATEGSGRQFKAADLAGLAAFNIPLRDALQGAGCSEPADKIKLGYWLRDYKNRVAGGWKLVIGKTAHGSARYWELRSK